MIHPNKGSIIAKDKPPVLKRLKISEEEWLALSQNFEANFSNWVGNSQKLEELTANHNMRHTADIQRCRQTFAA